MVNILQESEINFKSLERNIFKYGCEVACEELREMLQGIDRWLMKTRDKAIYRHKGHRKTCIKTLMGEVEYSRAVYEVMDGSSERKFVYLLDEYMGFDCVGFVSSNLAEKIADNICECSYAQTAKNMGTMGTYIFCQLLGDNGDVHFLSTFMYNPTRYTRYPF